MNRRALLIGAAAALVVLLAWYFLLWGPRNDEIADARDRQDVAESQAQQLRSEIERLQAAQRDEPLRRAQLETLRAAIPDDPNLAQFILDTNDAATKAGIDFISIAPTPPAVAAAQPAAATTATTTATTTPGADATPPAEIKVALQVQGGYFQVLDFVNRLNDLSRLVVIDSVSVSADQAGRLSASLQARMFTRELPAGFGGTTTTTTTAPTGATTTTVPGGATTTTAPGSATTTTAAGGAPTTTAGAQP
ncbi:MAG: type 4a pilus biogenesis protein PilO [Actinomycetota bacterium]|nr:type 4a pilus biogenesis protein PilO [Actinomycetota bacterium]